MAKKGNYDKLSQLVKAQQKYMDKMFIPRLDRNKGFDKDVYGKGEFLITKALSTYILALHVELSEVLQETNWKPWKRTKKPVDLSKVKKELIDCFHFMLQLLVIMGMDADEIFTEYNKKMNENIQRQKDGY